MQIKDKKDKNILIHSKQGSNKNGVSLKELIKDKQKQSNKKEK